MSCGGPVASVCWLPMMTSVMVENMVSVMGWFSSVNGDGGDFVE